MFANAEMASIKRSVTQIYQDANSAYNEGKWQDAIDGWYQVCVSVIDCLSQLGLTNNRQRLHL